LNQESLSGDVSLKIHQTLTRPTLISGSLFRSRTSPFVYVT